MTRDEIKQRAIKLLFEPTEEVINDFENGFEKFNNQIEDMLKINVDGVEPMSRVDETPVPFLREDTPGETMPREKMLASAPVTSGNFVSIKKVINES